MFDSSWIADHDAAGACEAILGVQAAGTGERHLIDLLWAT